ncbi:unnamed protein product [Anisakis simplex]|uniref:Uncharacterized protein n=1 Tax=Anisakis simplex TaxID=6269 RepID=A0A0M3J702_ANISI|nr:unnamed protein product [Anisakis simplex]
MNCCELVFDSRESKKNSWQKKGLQMMQLHQQSTLAGSGLGGGMSGSGDSGISSRTMVGQAPTSPEKSFLTRQRQCGTFNISR